MSLGDSPIVLDRDVVKSKPLRVSPTFAEWVADGNAEQIIKTASIVNTTSTLYTVPANFTLFITTSFLSSDNIAGGAGTTAAQLKIGSTIILRQLHSLPAGDHTSTSQDYPMPLRVNPNDTVTLFSDSANLFVSGGFTGFLLPRKISIR
jgi:hypothetical protein